MKKKLVFQKKIVSNLHAGELRNIVGGASGGLMCTDQHPVPPFDKSKANLCISQNICPSRNVC